MTDSKVAEGTVPLHVLWFVVALSAVKGQSLGNDENAENLSDNPAMTLDCAWLNPVLG